MGEACKAIRQFVYRGESQPKGIRDGVTEKGKKEKGTKTSYKHHVQLAQLKPRKKIKMGYPRNFLSHRSHRVTALPMQC